MEKKISNKMKGFLRKVDILCNEYQYQIVPNENKLEGELHTIIVETSGQFKREKKEEQIKLVYIDGDGCGFDLPVWNPTTKNYYK